MFRSDRSARRRGWPGRCRSRGPRGIGGAADHRRLPTVRLTRDLWQLERATSNSLGPFRRSRAHGAVADRAPVQEVQLAIAATPDAMDVGFWRAVLGYAPMGDDNGVDPLGHGSTVWMQGLDEAKPLRHAMHLDVSVAREQVEARLAAALAAGGRVVGRARSTGRSPIGPGTASASPPGPTGGSRRHPASASSEVGHPFRWPRCSGRPAPGSWTRRPRSR